MKYEILLNQLRDPIRLGFCSESDAVLIKEAADAIEELLGVIQRQREMINASAYLPLYPKPMKWISVTERLPELRMWESGSLASSNVLFVTEDKTIHIGYVMEDFHFNDNGCLKIDRWFMLGGYRIENVTHWMPLPSTEGLNET